MLVHVLRMQGLAAIHLDLRQRRDFAAAISLGPSADPARPRRAACCGRDAELRHVPRSDQHTGAIRLIETQIYRRRSLTGTNAASIWPFRCVFRRATPGWVRFKATSFRRTRSCGAAVELADSVVKSRCPIHQLMLSSRFLEDRIIP